jgi:hypothetical protein
MFVYILIFGTAVQFVSFTKIDSVVHDIPLRREENSDSNFPNAFVRPTKKKADGDASMFRSTNISEQKCNKSKPRRWLTEAYLQSKLKSCHI